MKSQTHFMDVRDKKPVLEIYSYRKDGIFAAVKKECSGLNQVCERGTINFVTRGYTKDVPFLPQMVYKRVRDWSLGQSLFI